MTYREPVFDDGESSCVSSTPAELSSTEDAHHVLVIDDETAVRNSFTGYLNDHGYRTTQAEDGQVGLLALENENPDIVIVDLRMPVLDGFSFITRAQEISPSTPIIVASVAGKFDVVVEAMRRGASDYITKPLEDLGILLHSVRRVIERNNLLKQNEQYKESLHNRLSELEASEARFRILFEESPIPIWQEDFSPIKEYFDSLREKGVKSIRDRFKHRPDEVYRCVTLAKSIDINKAALRLYGAKNKAELLSQFGRTFSQDSFDAFMDCLAALAAGRKSFQAETTIRTLTGKDVQVLTRWSVAPGHEDDLSIVLFSPIDITQRKMAEEAAWQAHAQLEQLFNSTADGICVIDRSYRVIRVNDSFPFFQGRTKQEIVGSFCHDSCNLSICQKDDCVLTRLLSGESRVEVDAIRQEGEKPRPFIVTATPVGDSKGNLTAIIEVFKDMSDRNELERQLVHAQKMESIGQLAAGIAHEINTPTQYVGDNTRFLRDAFSDLSGLLEVYGELHEGAKQGKVDSEFIARVDDAVEEADLEYLTEEIPQAVDQSLEGVERISEIVSAMKEFSHPGTEEKTSVDINRALSTTITVARNEWKYVAEMKTEFDASLPLVPCLPGELNQAVLNIIVNAAHAIGEKMESSGDKQKGEITLTTENHGTFAEIRISDTGAGIPEKLRQRIFDPFFTTKVVGKGTGQGLSIVHSVIVDKHDGEIDVISEEGQGTTFIIKLPLDDDSE